MARNKIDDFDELDDETTGGVDADSPDGYDPKRPLPYTIEEDDVKLPDGAKPEDIKTRSPFKKIIVAAFLLVAALLLFGSLILYRSMTKKDEQVSVKQESSQKKEDVSNEEKIRSIEQVKETAAAEPSPSPTDETKPSETTIDGGKTINQAQGAYPTVGVPIYDTSGINNPPVVSESNKTNSSGGGGIASASRTPSENPVKVPEENNRKNVNISDNLSRDNYGQTGSSSSGSGRNEQKSLYFYRTPGANGNSVSPVRPFNKFQSKPQFGTVFQVRSLGVLHTLQTGNMVRLELVRTTEGKNWRIPRGTVFVGRIAGGVENRLFVSIVGYIDSRSDTLVEISGDVLGRDGALGFEGKKNRLDSRWKKVFGDIVNKATQLGSSYLLGRNGGGNTTSIIDGVPQTLISNNQKYFISLEAGSVGYVLINDLPAKGNAPQPDLASSSELPANGKLTDEQIIRLLSSGSEQEIREALPLMSPEWRELAQKAVK